MKDRAARGIGRRFLFDKNETAPGKGAVVSPVGERGWRSAGDAAAVGAVGVRHRAHDRRGLDGVEAAGGVEPGRAGVAARVERDDVGAEALARDLEHAADVAEVDVDTEGLGLVGEALELGVVPEVGVAQRERRLVLGGDDVDDLLRDDLDVAGVHQHAVELLDLAGEGGQEALRHGLGLVDGRERGGDGRVRDAGDGDRGGVTVGVVGRGHGSESPDVVVHPKDSP